MAKLKDELREAGRDAAVEASKSIIGAIVDYFRREKPLRRWLRRKRLTRDELEAEAKRRAAKYTGDQP